MNISKGTSSLRTDMPSQNVIVNRGNYLEKKRLLLFGQNSAISNGSVGTYSNYTDTCWFHPSSRKLVLQHVRDHYTIFLKHAKEPVEKNK